MTIEWANCTDGDDDIPDLLAIEPREEKPRRAWLDHDVYHDGYIGKIKDIIQSKVKYFLRMIWYIEFKITIH